MTHHGLFQSDFAAGTPEAWQSYWRQVDTHLVQVGGREKARRRAALRRLVLDARMPRVFRWIDERMASQHWALVDTARLRYRTCLSLLEAALWTPVRSPAEMREDRSALAAELTRIAARLRSMAPETGRPGIGRPIERLATELAASSKRPGTAEFAPLGAFDQLDPRSRDPWASAQPKSMRAHARRCENIVAAGLSQLSYPAPIDYKVAASLVDAVLGAPRGHTKPAEYRERHRKNSARR